MKSMKSKKRYPFDGPMGLTVLGERGQVVIPKDVREGMGLKPSDQLIAFLHDEDKLVLVPTKRMSVFLAHMNKHVKQIGTLLKKSVV